MKKNSLKKNKFLDSNEQEIYESELEELQNFGKKIKELTDGSTTGEVKFFMY